jgi:PHD/YefM family antitoxin component YafN of YafNO toxin-antitoxin module
MPPIIWYTCYTIVTNQDEGNDMNAKRKNPEIILKDGKPRAVILDIDEYQEMLERLEDAEDLRVLEEK